MNDNILLKASSFYIKIVGAVFVVGQFGCVHKHEIPHNSLLNAVKDVHSRMIVGFHNSRPIMPLKEALEQSDEIILDAIGLAVQEYLSLDNVNITIGDLKL